MRSRFVGVDGGQFRSNPRLHFVDAIGQDRDSENVRQKNAHSFPIAPAALYRLEERPRDQAIQVRGEDRPVGFPKHLVHPMREKDDLAAIGVMIDAVVVSLHRVAIPVPGHDFHGDERDEPVHVHHLLQLFEALREIGLLGRRHQRLERRVTARLRAGHFLERPGNLLEEPAIPEVAIDVFEVLPEERFIESFFEHKQAEVATVQIDAGVRRAGGWNTRRPEQFAAKQFGQVTRILDGVVEMDLVQAMKSLAVAELVEMQGEGGLVIQVAAAASRSFNVNADIAVHGVAFPDR